MPKLVTQMGNQGHSGDDGRRVVELVRGGAIGKVKEVHVWTNRPVWPQGVGKPEAKPVPATLDWDKWLGPADVDWGYDPDSRTSTGAAGCRLAPELLEIWART